jgi:hypothetical protein
MEILVDGIQEWLSIEYAKEENKKIREIRRQKILAIAEEKYGKQNKL